jgi:hypothetical protein
VRVIKTEHTATHDAKNRESLPAELPLDFAKIAHCFQAVTTQPAHTTTPTTPPVPALAPALAPAPAPAPAPASKETNGAHKKLRDMMELSKITYDQLLGVIVAKGHYPSETPFENLDSKFIEGFCIPHWDKIIATIQKK